MPDVHRKIRLKSDIEKEKSKGRDKVEKELEQAKKEVEKLKKEKTEIEQKSKEDLAKKEKELNDKNFKFKAKARDFFYKEVGAEVEVKFLDGTSIKGAITEVARFVFCIQKGNENITVFKSAVKYIK